MNLEQQVSKSLYNALFFDFHLNLKAAHNAGESGPVRPCHTPQYNQY